MSQKTNPTSLRLKKTNKNFSSCWYSDYFFTHMSSHDWRVHSYMEGISNQIGHLKMFCYIKQYYKKHHIQLFSFDARGIRNEREKGLRLSRKVSQVGITPSRPFPPSRERLALSILWQKNETMRSLGFAFDRSLSKSFWLGYNTQSYQSLFTQNKEILSNYSPLVEGSTLRDSIVDNSIKNSNHFEINRYHPFLVGVHDNQRKLGALSLEEEINPFRRSNAFNGLVSRPNISSDQRFADQRVIALGTQVPITPFYNQINETLRSHFLNFISLYPIRVVQDSQLAQFLADEISYLLQRGASLKQIQNQIIAECVKNKSIKGVRLSCSGRMGGRSKKAQKSRSQSIQWGETSLHVFSSRLSFWKTSSSTPFGKVGIKVWLCYK